MNHMTLKKGISLLLYLFILAGCFGIPVVSKASSATEAFSAPKLSADLASPVVTAVNANQAGLTISWKPVYRAERYRILRRGENRWISIGETEDLQFTDLGVANNRPYTYTVVCCTKDGRRNVSHLGNFVSGIRLDTPVVTAVAGDEGTNLSWRKVANAKWYRVFRLEDGKWKALTNTAGTAYVDKTAKEDMSDRYAVRCISSDGKVWQSYFASTTGQFLPSPTLTHVDAVSSGIQVSWNAVKGASRYRVFYKTAEEWKQLTETAGLSVVDLTATEGMTKIYAVQCVSANGKRILSPISHEMQGTKLATPNVSAKSEMGKITLSWPKVSGALQYRVFRMDTDYWKTLGNTSQTSFIDTTVKPGVSYSYTVRCVSADGKQWQSGYKGIRVEAFDAPVLTHVDATASGIKLTWKAVEGAVKYRVFYKAENGWVKLKDTSSLSYEDTAVKEGTSRTYTVRCLSADGSKYTSSFLPGVIGKRLANPSVSFYAEKGKIKLSWSAVSGAGSYVVYGQSGSSWKRIGTTEKTTFSVSATSGKTVRYTVRCADKEGKNLYSYYQPTWGRFTTYSYRGASRQMAGNGTFSKTGGLGLGQQQAIQIYLNAYYSALGSFVNNTSGVFDNTKMREREQTIWNSVIAVRKEAFEDLSLTRYRLSGRVSSVKKVDADTVKVTVWVSCNQQFRDIPVLSQVFDNENWFTLKKDQNGTWWVSEHDADCSPFYHFRYDEKTKTDTQLSTMLYYLSQRKATWNGSLAKPGKAVSCDHPYNREKAKAYLLQWINKRNPDWFVYDPYGGNCMNFGSQVLVNGGIHQTSKWFWTPSGHTDSWTCVGDFADYAEKATRQELCCDTHANYYSGDVGDLVLIGITAPRNHTTVISGLVKNEQGQTIDYLLSCNTSDLKNFPASAYHYTNQHLIRIFGWDD